MVQSIDDNDNWLAWSLLDNVQLTVGYSCSVVVVVQLTVFRCVRIRIVCCGEGCVCWKELLLHATNVTLLYLSALFNYVVVYGVWFLFFFFFFFFVFVFRCLFWLVLLWLAVCVWCLCDSRLRMMHVLVRVVSNGVTATATECVRRLLLSKNTENPKNKNWIISD